jgi:hypothetical protein
MTDPAVSQQGCVPLAADSSLTSGQDTSQEARDSGESDPLPRAQLCLPNGVMFDALGEPRTRYVRVTLDSSHCIMRPSEGDTYLADAKENGDNSSYVLADVFLSEREFDDLPDFDGF